MGLLARAIEEAGIPTIAMTSARDITVRVKPPRGIFLDYPLGHPVGRPHDAENQRAILRAAFAAAEKMTEAGSLADLPFSWGEPGDRSWEEEIIALYQQPTSKAIMNRDQRAEQRALTFQPTTHSNERDSKASR